MKKMACFVLALSLVFSFCGCGKKNGMIQKEWEKYPEFA